MSRGSRPETSTRSARCWPTTSNSTWSRSYASKEKARSGNITLAMQPPNSGLSRRVLSMAALQCSYTIARSHSSHLLILLPWISMAIAWSRSMTSCLRVMRRTASTCSHSISHRGLSKDGTANQAEIRQENEFCLTGRHIKQQAYDAHLPVPRTDRHGYNSFWCSDPHRYRLFEAMVS